jgi:hypothetical protein
MHYQAISRKGATVDSGAITLGPNNVSANPDPVTRNEKAASQR